MRPSTRTAALIATSLLLQGCITQALWDTRDGGPEFHQSVTNCAVHELRGDVTGADDALVLGLRFSIGDTEAAHMRRYGEG